MSGAHSHKQQPPPCPPALPTPSHASPPARPRSTSPAHPDEEHGLPGPKVGGTSPSAHPPIWGAVRCPWLSVSTTELLSWEPPSPCLKLPTLGQGGEAGRRPPQFGTALSPPASPWLLTVVLVATTATDCPRGLTLPGDPGATMSLPGWLLQADQFFHINKVFSVLCSKFAARPNYLQGQVTTFSPRMLRCCPSVPGVLTLAKSHTPP